jgi:ammonium transporter, Amt family
MFDFATVDSGATAWVIVSAALVLFMTPGVAFFYGGMVRTKHVMSMLMQNFITIALVSLAWVVVGYTLAFGKGSGFIGDLHFAGLLHMNQVVPGFSGTTAMVIPPLVYVTYQMMFAIITPALITGATADRWKFVSFIPFILLWSLLVYSPIAHWIFSPTGWAARLGVLDFAGGIVVHSTAGAAALVMAIMLGRRLGWPKRAMKQHNLPLMLIGAAMLWFGWFGFNGGSALGANQLAATAFMNTNTAAAAAMLSWLVVERMRYGKATVLGGAGGAVAGLAAVTPCAGYVNQLGAIAIGVAAGALCEFAVEWKHRMGYDDALDVVGVHLVGGGFGALALGLFATKTVNPAGANGLFYGGGFAQLGKQIVGLSAALGYTVVMTFAIAYVLHKVVGNRVHEDHEELGLDAALHGETAYAFEEAETVGTKPAGADRRPTSS